MIEQRVYVAAEPGFNCAAPFRERLCRSSATGRTLRRTASIVPLPFGSGYALRGYQPHFEGNASIVPLPFGSGYPKVAHLTPIPSPASIVPLPFGSGYPA